MSGGTVIAARPSTAVQHAVRERADPCTMVICGALGDLSRRKLLPAIYQLMAEHLELVVDEMLVHQLVNRRQQLAAAQVAERAEDDHRARIGAVALRRRAAIVRGTRRNDRRVWMRRHVVLTAWPPNSFRSAAMTLAPKESVCRERKRASSESVITGAGTSRSIAS